MNLIIILYFLFHRRGDTFCKVSRHRRSEESGAKPREYDGIDCNCHKDYSTSSVQAVRDGTAKNRLSFS